jgi:methionyl-tRNA formyltransferase
MEQNTNNRKSRGSASGIGLHLALMVNRSLRIVFMGTPGFAVPALQYLLDAGYPVVAVVTAPDKPGGRGMKQMISSPVKMFAIENHIPVLQPENLKSKDFLQILSSFQADLQVVVAFRMLPEAIWKMPPMGTMNLHGSLLPAYRGAAPIQWSIINGDKVTGVTTFRLQHAIDTGEILLQREIPILPEDDAGTLHDRMMHIGASLVVSSVDWLSKGEAKTIRQDHSAASHAPKIYHEDAHVDWIKPAMEIYNLIRGMSPYPAAWSTLDGIELKIFKARISPDEKTKEPGTAFIKDKNLFVQTGAGAIELIEVQLAGKRKMSAKDFLNGYTVKDWSLT